MASAKSTGGGAGRGGRASHHISTIAHHFLGGGGDATDGRTAPCPLVLLAGLGPSALPTRHMLGLGRTLVASCPGAEVTFFEPVSAAPSVRDLTGEDLLPLSEDSRSWPGGLGPASLQGYRLPPSRGASAGDCRCFQLRNLIHVPEVALTAWEQLRDRPDLLPGIPATGTRLVWCLDTEALASLGQALMLGRLVDLLNPDGLEVILTPGNGQASQRSWVKRRVPGGLARTEETLASYRETLDHLLAPLPVHLTLLRTDPTDSAQPGGARYLEIAQRLSGQPPAGLAARS